MNVRIKHKQFFFQTPTIIQYHIGSQFPDTITITNYRLPPINYQFPLLHIRNCSSHTTEKDTDILITIAVLNSVQIVPHKIAYIVYIYTLLTGAFNIRRPFHLMKM